ncbi:nuclear transport factor 2 family protein [Thermodesulfobacteriota bacterium]
MSSEDFIGRFFELINKRDMDGFEDTLHEEAEFYFPKTQPLLGKNRIRRFFQILFRQFPELEFQVLKTIIQGSWVAVHWKNKGKNRKNEPYDNEGVTLLEIKEGKITYISDFFKDTEKF